MPAVWWLMMLSLSVMHDFHVSRMTMDFNPDLSALEVSMHIFTDDLELGLELAGHEGFLLHTDKEPIYADSLILEYLNRHIDIKNSEGQKAQIRWLGKESSDDYQATWIYFYIDLPADQGSFKMKQDILTEVYDDQQNIVNLRSVAQPSISLLTAAQPYFEFEIP